jgi:hypothetical protein
MVTEVTNLRAVLVEFTPAFPNGSRRECTNGLPGWLSLILLVALVPAALRANDFYVAPNGTPAGPGTMAQPFDLRTALLGLVAHPGDTFWLTNGTYSLGHVDTKIQGTAARPITLRSLPGQLARVDGSVSFFESAGYVILRNLEMYSSSTNRVSTQTNAGFNPTDISLIPGIASYVPNMSFINLIVHDQTRHGFYISQEASNNLIYGCIVYNNGWRSPDNAEGHGIYVQGKNGGRMVWDNIVFNNAGVDMHIYENDSNHVFLAGITLVGNLAFNAGAIQNVRAYRDWIVGVEPPAISADDILLEENMGYFHASPAQDNQVQIGRLGVNGFVTVMNNYFPPGLQLNNWALAAVSGNLVAAQSTNFAVSLNQAQVATSGFWNGNTYGVSASSNGFRNNTNALTFAAWQASTGFDQSSTCGTFNLTGNKVFVRPNQYEPGRANIVVYNWDNLGTVAVDVSSALTPGTPYEIRNAQNYFAGPVLSGVYDGDPLHLPMTGLTVAAPRGAMLTPPPTGPTLNVFVVLPQSIRLSTSIWNSQLLLISWPTNSSNWVLQSNPSLTPGSPWSDVPVAPTVLGNQCLVIQAPGRSNMFYRLRSQ